MFFLGSLSGCTLSCFVFHFMLSAKDKAHQIEKTRIELQAHQAGFDEGERYGKLGF